MADKLLHMHDGLLGHVPRPGARGTTSGAPVTIDADGLRYSGEPMAASDGPILAVGDSYTWGEDVSDLDAWPAQLQRVLVRRVLNGGVTGYGFDQTVLRAERLVERYKPEVAIVSFIADDIGRCEMRCMWWHDKPWFALEDGQLALKGVPVPKRAWRWPRLVRGVEGSSSSCRPSPSTCWATTRAPIGWGPGRRLRCDWSNGWRGCRPSAESGSSSWRSTIRGPGSAASSPTSSAPGLSLFSTMRWPMGSPPSTRSVASPPNPGRASSIGRCT
jgi:hypothetical protein